MEGLTWGAFAAVLAVVVSLCSVAAFFLGRKKAASEEGESKGQVATDLQYIKDTLKENTRAVENLTTKLDLVDTKREEDYRSMLVQITEMKSKLAALEARVNTITDHK